MCLSVRVCMFTTVWEWTGMSGRAAQHLSTQVSEHLGRGSDHREGNGRRSLSWKPGRGLQEARGVCLGLLTRIIAHVSIDCQASDVESLNDVAVPLLSVFNVM